MIEIKNYGQETVHKELSKLGMKVGLKNQSWKEHRFTTTLANGVEIAVLFTHIFNQMGGTLRFTAIHHKGVSPKVMEFFEEFFDDLHPQIKESCRRVHKERRTSIFPIAGRYIHMINFDLVISAIKDFQKQVRRLTFKSSSSTTQQKQSAVTLKRR